MKNTKTWVKVLLLAFCLVFVFSSLIACGTDEKIENLQSQLDELKNKTEGTATDLDTDKAAKDAAIAELKTALEAVKTTADAAATAAALQAVADELAADKVALASAVTELKAALETKATAEALEAKVAEVKALIDANAAADAEKAKELADAVAALTKTVNDNKTAVDTKIADEVKALNDAITAATGEATKAVNALTETVTANKIAAENAVATLTETMNTEVAKLQEAIAKANADIATKAGAAELEELKKTVEEGVAADVEELTTLINTKADQTKVDEAVAAANEAIGALETKVAALETKVEALKTAVEADIAGLKTAVEALNTKVAELANAAEINAAIEALTTRIETLENAMSADELAQAYRDATDALAGNKKITIEGVVENFDGSLAAFDQKFLDINANFYSEGAYAEFKAKYESLKFFLNRALSVEDIVKYFGEMDALVETLPTLVESLEAEVKKIEDNKLVTLGDECVDTLTAIYKKINETNEKETDDSKDIVIEEALETRYNTILAAHANLATADKVAADVEAAIDGVVTDSTYGLMYQLSDESLNQANYIVKSYIKNYFSDETYNALYADATNEASDLVANWTTYSRYMVRYNVLSEAAKAKPQLPDYVTNYAENKPMWSDMKALVTLVEEISAWRSANEIDEVNYALIYPNYANIDSAYAYAKYMSSEVYENLKVEELIKNVTEFCKQCEVKVLYKDNETYAIPYRKQIDAVLAAIKAHPEFDALSDHNDDKMLPYELLADFVLVENRMAELVELRDYVNNTLMKNTDKYFETGVAVVAFTDYQTILNFQKDIDGACSLYRIEKDDENYVALIAKAQERATALAEAYGLLTLDVAKMYVNIMNVLNHTDKLTLVDGHSMNEIETYWTTVYDTYRVTNPNLALEFDVVIDADGKYAIAGEDATGEATHISTNLAALNNQWIEVATQYENLADAAQAEAAELTARIEALESLSNVSLVNYEVIVGVWNDVNAWLEKYVGIKAADENVLAELHAILEIEVLNNAAEQYVFLAEDDFATLKVDYTKIVETYAAAELAWKDVMTQLQAAMDAYNNIHTDFEAPGKAFNNYATTFYHVGQAADLTAEIAKFGEVEAYAAFAAKLDEYTKLCGLAETAAEEIRTKIGELADKADDQAVVDAVAAIRVLIAAYKENYGCDVMICEKCGMDYVEHYMALERADATAKANLLKAAFEAKFTVGADTFFNADELNFIYNLFAGNIANDTKVEDVIDELTTFENKLVDWTARWELYLPLEKAANDFIATLDDDSVVTEEEVKAALATAANSIKKPANNAEYNNAVPTFNDAMKAFQAEIDAAEFAARKEEAKTGAADWVATLTMDEEQTTAVNAELAAFNAAIDAATTEEEVDVACDEFEAAVNAILTPAA